MSASDDWPTWKEDHWHFDGFGSVSARELVGSPHTAVVSVQFVPHRSPWSTKPPYAYFVPYTEVQRINPPVRADR